MLAFQGLSIGVHRQLVVSRSTDSAHQWLHRQAEERLRQIQESENKILVAENQRIRSISEEEIRDIRASRDRADREVRVLEEKSALLTQSLYSGQSNAEILLAIQQQQHQQQHGSFDVTQRLQLSEETTRALRIQIRDLESELGRMQQQLKDGWHEQTRLLEAVHLDAQKHARQLLAQSSLYNTNGDNNNNNNNDTTTMTTTTTTTTPCSTTTIVGSSNRSADGIDIEQNSDSSDCELQQQHRHHHHHHHPTLFHLVSPATAMLNSSSISPTRSASSSSSSSSSAPSTSRSAVTSDTDQSPPWSSNAFADAESSISPYPSPDARRMVNPQLLLFGAQ
jgi:hypothetical protein